jgi:hypothetical protein
MDETPRPKTRGYDDGGDEPLASTMVLRRPYEIYS